MAKQVYVTFVTVGQGFGTRAVIWEVGTATELATTQTRPYDFRQAALDDAKVLASQQGWEIVKESE